MLIEAAHLLRHIIDNIQGVTPLPGGSVAFAFAGDEAFFEHMCEWGSSIEDIEDDPDIEADGRDLPKLAAEPADGTFGGIEQLYAVPDDMVATALRIAA
ncbi:hypothetical protein [Methylobacterium sp. J-092]|uniref:hypothetical protein n=1 Tax=Methylobacterium sp. J-092 TaxID=2836667 RepID=UPI001FB8A833|nr:hypothetical protein [Methylobacterium sp. J-092]MCJ2009178.1 hypothetical protein [Methylobacterium sp. J-092]